MNDRSGHYHCGRRDRRSPSGGHVRWSASRRTQRPRQLAVTRHRRPPRAAPRSSSTGTSGLVGARTSAGPPPRSRTLQRTDSVPARYPVARFTVGHHGQRGGRTRSGASLDRNPSMRTAGADQPAACRDARPRRPANAGTPPRRTSTPADSRAPPARRAMPSSSASETVRSRVGGSGSEA